MMDEQAEQEFGMARPPFPEVPTAHVSWGVQQIKNKRQRQIDHHGYTPPKDVDRQGELGGFAYDELSAALFNRDLSTEEERVESLINAGALIAAALDAIWARKAIDTITELSKEAMKKDVKSYPDYLG